MQGQYWLSGTRGPVLGGHRPGHRPGPKKGGGGGSRGAGVAAFPAPSAPTLAPAAAWATQLTSFANCSSLRAPAARPGAPPASGGAGAGWGGGGGGGGGGDSSRLPPAPGRWGRPGPPPPRARIIIPVTCLPMHPKAGPRFCNTLRGRGGGPGAGRRGEQGLGVRPPQMFLLPWRIPKRSCQRRPGPGPRPGLSRLPLPP